MSVQSAAIHQFDTFKSGVNKLVDRVTTKPNWFGRAVTNTGEMIKAHPFAAVGAALGIGYVIMRVARRN